VKMTVVNCRLNYKHSVLDIIHTKDYCTDCTGNVVSISSNIL